MRTVKTLVVNLFAGAGAGKTTCAWEIASELEKRDINTEYVPEYAKELVWDENYVLLNDQEHVFKEQSKRIARLSGKVDVIVTDSPILLSEIYGRNNSTEFTKRIMDEHNKYCSFNLFIQRGNKYQQSGRIHTLEQSKDIDLQIKRLLAQNNIYYGTYNHKTVNIVIQNIQKTLSRIQKSEIRAANSVTSAPTDSGEVELNDDGNGFSLSM